MRENNIAKLIFSPRMIQAAIIPQKGAVLKRIWLLVAPRFCAE
jgi:hypothetical protein